MSLLFFSVFVSTIAVIETAIVSSVIAVAVCIQPTFLVSTSASKISPRSLPGFL